MDFLGSNFKMQLQKLFYQDDLIFSAIEPHNSSFNRSSISIRSRRNTPHSQSLMPPKTVPVKRKLSSQKDEEENVHRNIPLSQVNPDKEKIEAWTQSSLRNATALLGCFQIMMIILFASCSTFIETNADSTGTITQGYGYFIGVEIMM